MKSRRCWNSLVPLLFLCVGANLFAAPKELVDSSVTSSERLEEALQVRRLVELSKEEKKDDFFHFAQQYFEAYPEGQYADHLRILVAQVHLASKQWKKALSLLNAIKDYEVKKRAFPLKAQALYELKQWKQLTDYALPFVLARTKSLDDPALRFYIATAHQNLAKDEKSDDVELEWRRALTLFETLGDSPFASNALLASIEGHLALGEEMLAAKKSQELAKKAPQLKKRALYLASQIEERVDPAKSRETLEKIMKFGGAEAEDAALRWMTLTYELQLYDEIVQRHDYLMGKVGEDDRNQVYFVTGSSAFLAQKYAEATHYFELFLDNTVSIGDLTQAQKRLLAYQREVALESLFQCAYDARDLKGMNRYLFIYEKEFPGNKDLAKGLLYRALMYEERGDPQETEDLYRLATGFPSFPQREAVLLKASRQLMEQEQYGRAREVVAQFLSEYPNHKDSKIAWQILMVASVNYINDHREEKPVQVDETTRAIDDLVKMFDSQVLEPQEKWQLSMQFAKLLMEQGTYRASIAWLKIHADVFAQSNQVWRAYLMLALSYSEGFRDGQNFDFYAQKALEVISDKERANLLIPLFNEYIRISERSRNIKRSINWVGVDEASPDIFEVRRKDWTKKAAELLYEALTSAGPEVSQSIGQKNVLWLANFYYKEAFDRVPSPTEAVIEGIDLVSPGHFFPKKFEEAERVLNTKKAIMLFQRVLAGGSEKAFTDSSVAIAEGKEFLEREIFKLSKLYVALGQYAQQQALLERLHDIYLSQANRPWTLTMPVLFDLATGADYARNYQLAFKAYEALIEQPELGEQKLFWSQLRGAKAAMKAVPDSEKLETNPMIKKALEWLDGLKVRRQLATEPLHLEGALEHIALNTLIETNKFQGESFDKARFVQKVERDGLTDMKEEFSQSYDLISQAYAQDRAMMPEKDRLFQSYMVFVDARIAELEMHLSENRRQKMGQRQLAMSLYQLLTGDIYKISDLLKLRACGAYQRISGRVESSCSKISKDTELAW